MIIRVFGWTDLLLVWWECSRVRNAGVYVGGGSLGCCVGRAPSSSALSGRSSGREQLDCIAQSSGRSSEINYLKYARQNKR